MLARRYTDSSSEMLKEIYDRAGLGIFKEGAVQVIPPSSDSRETSPVSDMRGNPRLGRLMIFIVNSRRHNTKRNVIHVTMQGGTGQTEDSRTHEEKDKLDAEAERSRSVVVMKSLHAEIEKIEKERKSLPARSAMNRIDLFISFAYGLGKSINEDPILLKTTLPANVYKELTTEYNSIREDFRKVAELDVKRMEELFPSIGLTLADGGEMPDKTLSMCMQLSQMKAYMERYSI